MRTEIMRSRFLLAAVGCALYTQASAAAESAPMIATDRFVVETGVFLSDFDTSVALAGPNGGGEISLEDNLDLDSDLAVFRGNLSWRFLPRHRVSLGYYEFGRDQTAVAQDAFVLDTERGVFEFAAGARVRANFDWRLAPLTYAYSLVQRDRWELAGVVGLHNFKASVGFAGAALVNGVPVFEAAAAETTSAPLPVLGMDGQYAITPRWRVRGEINWFGLSYDDFEGQLVNARVLTEYALTDWVDLGIGYTRYNINVDVDNGANRFEFDYEYEGLEAMATFRF